MQIIKYDGTQEKYNSIVAEKQAQGFTLTDVANVTEGNFLGFKEPSEIQEPIVQTSLEEKINNLQNTVDILLLKQEGLI